MSGTGEILLDWGGEERPFRLKLKQLELLQERCGDRGPNRMLRDLMSGDWKIRDILETIRLGLVGGGLSPAQADKLCRDYVEDRPLAENMLFALAILQAAIVGPPLDETKPKGGAPPGEKETPTAGSTSASSTETEQPSDGALQRLVN